MQPLILTLVSAVALSFGFATYAQADAASSSDLDSLIRKRIQIEIEAGDGEISILGQIPPEAWAKLDSQEIRDLVHKSLEVRVPSTPWESSADTIVPVVAIVSVFATPIIIVVLVLIYRRRISQQRHSERMALIEKGIVDPEIFAAAERKEPRPQRWTVWGIILAAAGVGLIIMDLLEGDFGEIGTGVFVGLIGAALVISARYMEKKRGDNEEPKSGPNNEAV